MNEAIMPERADQLETGRIMTAPGAQLAAHRKALGWSVEDVAEQLKLAPRQVVALEADNYAALPGMAIVRGFIRAYAKILRIDPLPLVAMISVDPMTPKPSIPLRRERTAPFSEVRLPSMNRRGLPAVWLAGVIIVVLLVIILGGQHMGWVPSPYNMGKTDMGKTDKEAASASVSASASTPAANPANADKSADPAASVRIEPNVASPQATPKPVAPAPIAATPVTPVAAEPTSVATNNALVIKVRHDSWVEVKRANGTALISRLVKAGSTETFDIKEPVLLIIGNVTGVEVTLRGTALQLKPGVGNMARINLK